jgi:hypothetical protein
MIKLEDYRPRIPEQEEENLLTSSKEKVMKKVSAGGNSSIKAIEPTNKLEFNFLYH